MKIKDAYEDYIHYIHVVDQKSLATIQSYTRELSTYIEYLKEEYNIVNMEEITLEHIQEYIYTKNAHKKAASIKHLTVVIKSFHKYISLNHSEIYNPIIYINYKKSEKKLPKLIDREDLYLLLDEPKQFNDKNLYHQCILEVLYGCGVRASECCDITMNNIHLQEGFIKVKGKGDKERIIPINKNAISLLQIYIDTIRPTWNQKRLPYLFINHLGNRLTRQYIHTMIKNKCKELNIDTTISAHSFRHSFATHLLDGNADLRVVQELLGHSDLSTTQIYTHVQNEKLKKVYLDAHPLSKK